MTLGTANGECRPTESGSMLVSFETGFSIYVDPVYVLPSISMSLIVPEMYFENKGCKISSENGIREISRNNEVIVQATQQLAGYRGEINFSIAPMAKKEAHNIGKRMLKVSQTTENEKKVQLVQL
jgi:hypothetical protein